MFTVLYRLSAALLLASLIGCYGADEVALAWSSEPGRTEIYRAYVGPRPSDEAGVLQDVRGDSPMTAEDLLSRAVQRREVVVDETPSSWVLTMEAVDGERMRIRAEMPPLQDFPVPGPDASPAEREDYEFRKLEAGVLQLWSVMDRSGRSLSFYLQNRQQNLVHLLFSLPSQPVHVGDRWSLPVRLFELAGYYDDDATHRVAFAQLVSLDEDVAGEQVAGIAYVVSQFTEGKYEGPSPRLVGSFRAGAVYVGFGEFEVRSSRWRRYIGQLKGASSDPTGSIRGGAQGDEIFVLEQTN